MERDVSVEVHIDLKIGAMSLSIVVVEDFLHAIRREKYLSLSPPLLRQQKSLSLDKHELSRDAMNPLYPSTVLNQLQG